jgi:hypothetical protein
MRERLLLCGRTMIANEEARVLLPLVVGFGHNQFTSKYTNN